MRPYTTNMAWEERSGNTYYYRKRRHLDPGGEARIHSDYLGRGKMAEVAHALDRARKAAGCLQGLGLSKFKRELRAAERAQAAHERAVLRILRLHLTSLGFYRHRGQWRRSTLARPIASTSMPITENQSANVPAPAPYQPQGSRADIEDYLQGQKLVLDSLLEDAETLEQQALRSRGQGSAEDYDADLKALRASLRGAEGAWAEVEALGQVTEKALAGVIGGRDAAKQQEVLQSLRVVRKQLGADQAPALERLLIDQVAIAWLSAETVRRAYAAAAFAGGAEPEHGPYWESRMDRAEDRLRRASESLARTRKLIRDANAATAAESA